MWALVATAAALAATAAPPQPTSCFVEHKSSQTVKNMCERAFHRFPQVGSAEACAAQCVADETCVMFAWALQGSPQCRLSATCRRPTNALLGFDGYFRTSTTGPCKPSTHPPPPSPRGVPGNWTRVFLTAAAQKGAVCIDGSPAAYYIRTANAAGIKADPKRWILFMEGGGWAYSLQGSVGRMQTNLGSSKGYPVVPTGMEGTGLFSTAPFDAHTVVYAKYCDGGSFSGALSNPPVKVGNVSLFFRGRGILDGIFDSLIDGKGMSQATELLFAGCSAGGLTTYIHADYVTAVMARRAPDAKVVALADAMYSLNHLDYKGDSHWPGFMSWVYHTMDRDGNSVNDDCVSHMAETYGVPKGNRSEGWRCMFGASVAPFVQTPTFVLNSKYDHWQGAQIIGAGRCADKIANCSSNLTSFWVGYGKQMLEKLDALPTRHGAYIHNCQSHCQTGTGPWSTDTVNGTHMHAAVAAFYAAALRGEQAQLPRHVDRCDEKPCAGDICNGRAYGYM